MDKLLERGPTQRQPDDPARSPPMARNGLRGPFAEAGRMLDDIRGAMEQDPERAHAAALQLTTLLASSARMGAGVTRGGLPVWKRRKVDQYLRERLTERLEVAELAEVACLSVAHFHRAFKETFGDTPHAYIVRLRLDLARTLMLATEDPLSQIAIACGFADQAHFSTNFRARLGVTPSVWRRRSLFESRRNATSQRPMTRGAGSAAATATPSPHA